MSAREPSTARPSYVRLYADDAGETHFEDVHLPTHEQAHGSGALTVVSDLVPVEGLIFRTVVEDVGSEVPHHAPRRQLIITLEGAAAVTVSDGECRVFGPGSVVLAEDTTGKGHRTEPVGTTPRVTLFAPLPATS
jgi:quercetin dioxygenase-like cupin family protein